MSPFFSTVIVFGLVGLVAHVFSRWSNDLKILAAVINVACLSVCTGALNYGWAAPEDVSTLLQVLLFQNVFLLKAVYRTPSAVRTAPPPGANLPY